LPLSIDDCAVGLKFMDGPGYLLSVIFKQVWPSAYLQLFNVLLGFTSVSGK